jgi:hypothetical protein
VQMETVYCRTFKRAVFSVKYLYSSMQGTFNVEKRVTTTIRGGPYGLCRSTFLACHAVVIAFIDFNAHLLYPQS